MQQRELLGTARVPGGEELRLFAKGGDFVVALDRNELMSSRMTGSEEALATMTAARLGSRKGQHWLIGGYGMGFTLRAALAVLPADAQAMVVELVPEIVEWARGPMAALTAGCLDDPRTRLRMGDVADAIAQSGRMGARGLDAILLDVDNGPDGLVRAANDRLYSAAGLEAARAALAPGGVLAVWSAAPDQRFVARLKRARFAVEEVPVRARGTKGPRHVIWLAR